MIYYSKEKESLPARVKALTRAQAKIPFVLWLIVLVLAVYFLIVSFITNDREAWINAYASVFIVVISSASYLITFHRFKNQLYEAFDKVAVDGKVDYSIERNDGTFEVKNLNEGTNFIFHRSDISKIIIQENIIVVKLKSRRVTDFPNIKEIRALLEQ